VAYWTVELDAVAGFDRHALPCSVITYRRWAGNHTALIECEPSTAAVIRGLYGVNSVELAPDGPYVDESGETCEVSGGGSRCSFVGR
jgi:hypothetical protein